MIHNESGLNHVLEAFLHGRHMRRVVQALAPNFSLSLAEMNIVNVYTDSNDSVEAYVTGASRVSALKVDILANGTAEVTATGAVPGVTVSLVNGNAVLVTATAAKGTNGKVTKAYVGRDSEVYANL